jgi:hypothetical protein
MLTPEEGMYFMKAVSNSTQILKYIKKVEINALVGILRPNVATKNTATIPGNLYGL